MRGKWRCRRRSHLNTTRHFLFRLLHGSGPCRSWRKGEKGATQTATRTASRESSLRADIRGSLQITGPRCRDHKTRSTEIRRRWLLTAGAGGAAAGGFAVATAWGVGPTSSIGNLASSSRVLRCSRGSTTQVRSNGSGSGSSQS